MPFSTKETSKRPPLYQFDVSKWISSGSLCTARTFQQSSSFDSDVAYCDHIAAVTNRTSNVDYLQQANDLYQKSNNKLSKFDNHDSPYEQVELVLQPKIHAFSFIDTSSNATNDKIYSKSYHHSREHVDPIKFNESNFADDHSCTSALSAVTSNCSTHTSSSYFSFSSENSEKIMSFAADSKVWKSAICPNTGKTYYYNVHTRETQWQKPLCLAEESERLEIAKREKQQLQFFSEMEANILKCMRNGYVPGTPDSIAIKEDISKPLPIKNITTSKNTCKPFLMRTISSMDEKLLSQLAGAERNTKDINTVLRPLNEKVSVANGKGLPKPTFSKRNTCGTIYLKNTMATPDVDATIKCVCGVIRAHLIQSEEILIMNPRNATFEEYEIFNDHSKCDESQKSYSFLRISNNSRKSSKLKPVPSLEEMTMFFCVIFKKAQMENDCVLMTLIYIERLMKQTNGGVRPNANNWRSLIFSCMIMASKVWDDLSMWNKDFTKACPPGIHYSLKRINELEVAVLSCLKYDVKVSASEYAKYYFLIRSMLIRCGLASEDFVDMKPLDLDNAKEFKFEKMNKCYVSSHLKHQRSKSYGADESLTSSGRTSPHVNLEQVVKM